MRFGPSLLNDVCGGLVIHRAESVCEPLDRASEPHKNTEGLILLVGPIKAEQVVTRHSGLLHIRVHIRGWGVGMAQLEAG